MTEAHASPTSWSSRSYTGKKSLCACVWAPKSQRLAHAQEVGQLGTMWSPSLRWTSLERLGEGRLRPLGQVGDARPTRVPLARPVSGAVSAACCAHGAALRRWACAAGKVLRECTEHNVVPVTASEGGDSDGPRPSHDDRAEATERRTNEVVHVASVTRARAHAERVGKLVLL